MNASFYFVQLTVRDLGAASAWYREVMGMREVMREADSFAILSSGAARLALTQGMPAPGGVLLAFEVADLGEWVRGFAEHGGSLEGEMKTSAEGYRRARTRDADGYEVSVFEWTNETSDGAGAEAPIPSRE